MHCWSPTSTVHLSILTVWPGSVLAAITQRLSFTWRRKVTVVLARLSVSHLLTFYPGQQDLLDDAGLDWLGQLDAHRLGDGHQGGGLGAHVPGSEE